MERLAAYSKSFIRSLGIFLAIHSNDRLDELTNIFDLHILKVINQTSS